MVRINSKVNNLVMTALMCGLIMLVTFMIRIPVPGTKGYIHPGDCMIFLAVLILGWKHGAIAAGVGSALADLMGGYAMYAPVTLLVKAVMAAVVGLFIQWAMKKHLTKTGLTVMGALGMSLGGMTMVAGYYFAECAMYGSFITPLAGVSMNILQFLVGIGLALTLVHALSGSPVGKALTYNITAVPAGRNRSADKPLPELRS